MKSRFVVRAVSTAAVALGLLISPSALAGTPIVNRPAPLTPDAAGVFFAPLLPATQVGQMFKFDLPQPVFYTPDQATFPGFDYYEIDMSPVEHVSTAGGPLANVFPTPPAGATQHRGNTRRNRPERRRL